MAELILACTHGAGKRLFFFTAGASLAVYSSKKEAGKAPIQMKKKIS